MSEGSSEEATATVKLGEAVNSVEEAIKALSALIRERPLIALLLAGTLGWVMGRKGKYI